jgi:galactokinase
MSSSPSPQELNSATTPTTSYLELFVPGRVCLFGEHSDWAGGFRREDPTIPVGKCLISGTNQGLYARVAKHDQDRLILKSTLDHGEQMEIELPLEDQELLNQATSNGLWCYICGVTYQLKKAFPHIGGIVLDNYKTTLPVKKGLSSSAAVCVLTARAFNELYNLNLTKRQEMEFAFLGETTTPSKCGRMDQGCAYGVKPVLMTFDGDNLEVDEAVHIGGPIHLILVDLCASKDTPAILNDLQRAYPQATCHVTRGVQKLLGEINHAILEDALLALRKGCPQSVGAVMNKAQQEFDKYAIPASPQHLSSPVLHKLLTHQRLQPHVYGGKGVGSQGDGSAQFVVRSLEDQRAAIDVIENDFGMTCLSMSLGVES